MSDFASRLKESRVSCALTQKRVADLLEINERTYRLYEMGEVDLPSSRLIQLCRLLDVSSDYLLGLSEGKTYVSGDKSDEIRNFSINRIQESLYELSSDNVSLCINELFFLLDELLREYVNYKRVNADSEKITTDKKFTCNCVNNAVTFQSLFSEWIKRLYYELNDSAFYGISKNGREVKENEARV